MERSAHVCRRALLVEICQDQCGLMVGRAKYQLTKRKIILAEVDVVALMQSAASLATGQAKAMSKAAQTTSSCACEVLGERGYDLQWSQR